LAVALVGVDLYLMSQTVIWVAAEKFQYEQAWVAAAITFLCKQNNLQTKKTPSQSIINTYFGPFLSHFAWDIGPIIY
jgi:hypothetical protein